ncbi:MAG: sigma-70 family RNA polymerase sigma factor [bacterium]|nr:sigma-70 family RNA polymerase sigma factor [bacterium]
MEAVFLEHLELIEQVAEHAGRRAGFPRQDVEDFVSTVKVRLIDGDYAVLRKHRGESSLTTFLTTVVHNLFKDFCDHKLGKFRPSAKAKQLGPTALALERLLVRDQHDLETAIVILKSRHEVEASADELGDVAAQLPVRYRRRLVGEEKLADRASEAPEAAADQRVEDGERSQTAMRVEGALNLALETLSPQDLLILKMYFRDDCSVATISSALGLKQRPLYTRKEKCLRTLRAAFDAQGLTWEEVREILGWQGREIRADFGAGDGKSVERSV